MNKKDVFRSLALAALVAAGPAVYSLLGQDSPKALVLGHGEIGELRSSYQRWTADYESHGGKPEVLRLGLSYSKTLSASPSKATGLAEINLVDGAVNIRLSNAEPGRLDAWLVDNRPHANASLKPEAGDAMLKLGSFEIQDGKGELHAQLNREQLQGFTLDMVAITPADRTPAEDLRLTGAPGLMQQLYYSDKLWAMAGVGGIEPAQQPQAAPFDFILPKLAHAAGHKDRGQQSLDNLLGAEIARGRDIFLNETFDGNGRTCATCHRLDNNHTIDPAYIAKLPADDPLFIAETNPDLAELEKPALLRQFGLVLANVDGFDKPGVMRSVPHTLALATSIDIETPCNKGEFQQDTLFTSALGWAGDGSPANGIAVDCKDPNQVIPHPNGSLRDFAIGAVKQHMPKTLNRAEGADFRLPTDEELVAMEAYMLSLGRSKDYDLPKLEFKSPVVQRGMKLFDTKENFCQDANGNKLNQSGGACPGGTTLVLGETANCNGCHSNAGARSSTTHANPTRNTGIESMRDQLATLVDPSAQIDGGFGTDQHDLCGPFEKTDPLGDHPCFGDKRFNTPTLVEAADTGPYFHNHSVNSLEEAIAFYNTDAFNDSPGALTSSRNNRKVKLDSSQVVAVALFLRSLNAIENIRQSNELAEQAMQLRGADAEEITHLAAKETQDAIQVLKGGSVLPYPDAVAKLEEALKLEKKAENDFSALRNSRLKKAIELKRQARDMMVSCNPGTPSASTTLPEQVYTCDELI